MNDTSTVFHFVASHKHHTVLLAVSDPIYVLSKHCLQSFLLHVFFFLFADAQSKRKLFCLTLSAAILLIDL